MKINKFMLSTAVALVMLGGCASSKDASSAVNLPDQGANTASAYDMPEESADENLGHISYLKFDVDQNVNALPILPFEAQSSGQTLLQKRFNSLDLKAPSPPQKMHFGLWTTIKIRQKGSIISQIGAKPRTNGLKKCAKTLMWRASVKSLYLR